MKTLLPWPACVIDAETLATAKATIDHAKVKAGMPTDVDPERMAACRRDDARDGATPTASSPPRAFSRRPGHPSRTSRAAS